MWNSTALCKNTNLKSPATFKHRSELAQHCICTAYISQPGRIRASKEICVDLCCARLAFPTEVAGLSSPPGGKTSSSLSLSGTAKAEIPSALSSPSYRALATTKMTFVRVYLSYYLCLQLLTYLVKQWIYILPS